jgi:hypothetical protein
MAMATFKVVVIMEDYIALVLFQMQPKEILNVKAQKYL